MTRRGFEEIHLNEGEQLEWTKDWDKIFENSNTKYRRILERKNWEAKFEDKGCFMIGHLEKRDNLG